MNPSNTSACGILFCYNEEHIIGECLKHYLNQGIDLVVIDNESTDSSMDIVKTFQLEQEKYPGRILDVVNIKTDGFEVEKILQFAGDYIHKNLSCYEWILLIDSDAFYHSPVRGMSLLEFMDFVKKYGYNIIDTTRYEFYPTEKDDPSIASPLERMHYCVRKPFSLPEQKIFRYHPTIKFSIYSIHFCNRDNTRVCVINALYNHYPWVSFEHGLKKIFKERKPRYFVERRKNPTFHPHYLEMLPIKRDFVKLSKTLNYYNKEKLVMSAPRLRWIMRMKILIDTYATIKSILKKVLNLRYVVKIRNLIKRFWNIFLYDKHLAFQRLISCSKEKIKKRLNRNLSNQKSPPPMRFSKINLNEIVQQKPRVYGLPETYHFLMTNYCNARCIFCNQMFDNQPKKEITFDKFKVMLSNMLMVIGSSFHFSGGGEPLLCRDFFTIIDYVNTHFPWIKTSVQTNGLLIGKYAKELAQSNIRRLQIAVHGITVKTNNTMLGIEGQSNIFENITMLNKQMANYKSKMQKIFCIVVSQRNIDEIQGLIKKAADLNVDGVYISFCRYYPYDSHKANIEESLFFDKKKYNEIILKSKKLAKKLNICFDHEPLFFHKFKEKPCFQPWHTMLIDWDGDIYPCTGGEVWFDKKVKSGKYHFGNLLREHLTECWNNDSYVIIRRTCSRHYKEDFIPECKNCHNTICLKGPDVKRGHILEVS